MSALIIDGRKAREDLLPDLAARIKNLSFVPTLAIIQVGNRPDSTSFIKAKKAFAKKIGVNEKHIQVAESIPQSELVDLVKKCNVNADIHGIIVQLPLPIHLDRDAIIDSIDPAKDVDALTAHNVKRWLSGRGDSIIPATARGIRELLRHYNIDLFGKKVTVVGRSMLVGKPITSMCVNENATVSVCHSKTPDLAEYTRQSDIVIVAAGKPGLIRKEHVKEGQVIIDVGINSVSGSDAVPVAGSDSKVKLVGDVDFEQVKDIAAAITPVPGGVGPMTVFGLFENLADLCAGK